MKMSYIQNLQRQISDKDAEIARLREGFTEIMAYCQSPKFHNDTTVQVNDILTRIREIL